MSQRIRLRYSTIVNYISMMYKVAASLAFTVVVARRLDVESFGLWGVILSVSAVLLSPIGLWGFWVQRFQARGRENAGLTGFAVTVVYSLVVAALFAVAGVSSSTVLGSLSLQYFLAAVPLAALFCLMNYLNLLSRVVKPELIGYANFIYDTLRVIVAYYLVAYMRAGLLGVITAVEAAQVLTTLYLAYGLWVAGGLRGVVSWDLAKSWLKASYVPLLNIVASGLRGGFRAYIAWLTGSSVPVAYYNVAFTVETPIIRASNAATPALYARMLRGDSRGNLEETVSLIALFTGFITASILAVPHGILALFGHNYVEAATLLQLVTVYALLQSLVPILSNVLLGVERVDAAGIPSLRKLATSLLVRVPAMDTVSLLAVYGGLTVTIFYTNDSPLVPIEVLALLLIVTRIPLLAYYIREVKRRVTAKLPLDPLAPILVASVATAVTYILLGADTVYSKLFWSQLLFLAYRAFLAAAVYAAVLYASSKWFRMLIIDIMRYIGSPL